MRLWIATICILWCTTGSYGVSNNRKTSLQMPLKRKSPFISLELLETSSKSPATSRVRLIIWSNFVFAICRCLLTMGQPYRRAEALHLAKQLSSEDDSTILPGKYLPSLSALFHLGITVLSSILLLSFMQVYAWLEKIVLWKKCRSLQRAEAVYVVQEPGHSAAIVKLAAPENSNGQLFEQMTACDSSRSLLDLEPTHSSGSSGKKSIRILRTFTVDGQAHVLTEDQAPVPITPHTSHLSFSSIQSTVLAHIKRGGLASSQAKQRLGVYGMNTLSVPLPSMQQQLEKRFLNPFALMQMSTQFLSILEESWFGPVSRIVTTIASEAFQIYRDCSAVSSIRASAEKSHRAETSSSSPGPMNDDKLSSGSLRNSRGGDGSTVWVLRDGQWSPVPRSALVPGDIISLSTLPPDAKIPCDCMLLTGSAIVSEAAQTGESVPQRKSPISEFVPRVAANESFHASPASSATSEKIPESASFSVMTATNHVLLSGSTIVQSSARESLYSMALMDRPGRALHPLTALVLHTGTHSTQGSLMRKMKSLNSVASYGTKQQLQDAQRLYFLLAFWAAVCSVHLAIQGPCHGRDSFSIAVQITRLISSAVPADLQSELMFTVHDMVRKMSVSCQLYCMDPNRLTTAGLVSVCVLDKTGTITSDSMVVSGCYQYQHNDTLLGSCSGTEESHGISPTAADRRVQAGLMTCHTLLHLSSEASNGQAEGTAQMAGDPMEMATLQALLNPSLNNDSWSYNPSLSCATLSRKTAHISSGNSHHNGDPDGSLCADAADMLRFAPSQVFEFDPLLRRMTVVSSFNSTQHDLSLLSSTEQNGHVCGGREELGGYFVSSKGAPESIWECLHPSQRHDSHFRSWYQSTFAHLSGTLGLRVLAVATKCSVDADAGQGRVGATTAMQTVDTMDLSSRLSAEQDLHFGCFLAFNCPIRADSKAAVSAMKKAGIDVIMCTGDGLGTALHVAREVGIGDVSDQPDEIGRTDSNRLDGELILSFSEPSARDQGQQPNSDLVWTTLDGRQVYRYWSPAMEQYTHTKLRRADQKSINGSVVRSSADVNELSYMSCRELALLGGHTLAVTGAVWRHFCDLDSRHNAKRARNRKRRAKHFRSSKKRDRKLHAAELKPLSPLRDLLHCSIFARIDPDSKTSLVQALQTCPQHTRRLELFPHTHNGGWRSWWSAEKGLSGGEEVVLMCGDGSNDIGALRAADVGLALLGGHGLKNAILGDGTNGTSTRPLKIAENSTETFAARREKMQRRIETLAAQYRNEARKQNRFTLGIREYFRAMGIVARENQVTTPQPSGSTGEGPLGEEHQEIRIGDASIAAPFTSRRPSLFSVLDLVRYGRTTHCIVLQNYLSVALDCLLCGHALSHLHLLRVKKSMRHYYLHMICGAVLTAAAGTMKVLPADELTSLPPPRSIFTAPLLYVLAVQTGAHILATRLTLSSFAARDASATLVVPEKRQTVPAAAASKASTFGPKYVPTAAATAVCLLDLLRVAITPSLTHIGRPWLQSTKEIPALAATTQLLAHIISILAAMSCVAGDSGRKLLESLDLVPLGIWGGAGLGVKLVGLWVSLHWLCRDVIDGCRRK